MTPGGARPAAALGSGPVADTPRDGEVLCVGEVLWDALPAGLFLGGAPLNVACHLRAAGVPAAVVSRVGRDALGDEVVRRAAAQGVDATLVQGDPLLPTGFVRVALDAAGNATYDIVAPAAWDAVEADDRLLERAARARAVVFGTLAQRDARTRATVERLWQGAALRVFDVNLRPPYDDRAVVERSLGVAHLAKLNDLELHQLARWFGLRGELRAQAEGVAARFGCGAVCVTRGVAGAALWRDGRWTEDAGFRVEVRDTVGAGDAFLASLLAGLFAGADDGAMLREANLVGAYVASQPGAVPAYDRAAIAAVAAGRR